nr:helix-turn-helix transcriptional regulator [Hydrocarboniphaga sp.]
MVALRGDESQTLVAERMGTSQSMLSKLERGVVRMDLSDLLSYLDAIGKDPLEFITDYLHAINWRPTRRKPAAAPRSK